MIITIYTSDGCVFCDRAKQLCKTAGVDYREVNIHNVDKEWLKFKIVYEPRTVPQIFFDQEYIGGYEDLRNFFSKKGEEWNNMFNKENQHLPKVEIRRGNFEFALRRFKRSVNKAGTLQEARERMYYEKPAQRRRKAKMAGELRWRKKERELDPVRFGKKKQY